MVDQSIIERSRALNAWHTRWALEQIAKGVDGPAPEGSPTPTDYNQHYPDMEADGAAEDAYDRRAREIMGLPPL